MAKTRSPSAGIVLYNYVDRGGTSGILDTKAERILITRSIVSISTYKQKSRSSGSFDIRLAPSKNWTGIITPGSWLEIHMSPYMMSESDLVSVGTNLSKTLKMIGVVDTVRMNVTVDQNTGARNTTYMIKGRDWGAALESFLYIDTAITTNKENPLVNAVNLMSTINLKGADIGLLGTFTPADMANKLIKQWGQNMSFAASDLLNLKQAARYTIPLDLAQKIEPINASSNTSQQIADRISIVSGKLSSKDEYSASNESVGVLSPQALVGTNTVWQLLEAHSNTIVNELVTDLRWKSGSNRPSMALYQRVKPFWVRNTPKPDWTSSFFNLKSNSIDKNDIISLDIGDNAEDVVNFIEVLPDLSIASLPGHEKVGIIASEKAVSSVVDPVSISRFGLKPIQYSSIFAPIGSSGTLNWGRLKEWLPVIREWYFDCHKMLNGTFTMVGQSKYIGVGENIAVDSSVLGNTYFVNGEKTTFVGHIETVNHTFRYLENGSRSFITNVSFVRGVIANANADSLINNNALGIETNTSSVPSTKTTIKNVSVE